MRARQSLLQNRPAAGSGWGCLRWCRTCRGWPMPEPAADFDRLVSSARDVVRQHLGVPVQIGERTVRVIWTVTEAAPTLGGLRQGIVETAALLHPQDAVHPDVTRGAVVVRDGKTWTVADVLPRSDGWTMLILRGD